jgi:cardiolipin synthase (CMP-forming)
LILNVPNLVTLSRIILIPLLIGIYYLPEAWMTEQTRNLAAALVFIFAGITDWLDGYLARRLNQMSAFGAFLDPVADKLIVAGALVVLLFLNRVDMLVALIIIGREIAISALREWMSQLGARKHVAVTFFGKWKTALQITGISLMLYEQPLLGLPVYPIGMVLLLGAAALTLWSMVDYLRAAWPIMMGAR